MSPENKRIRLAKLPRWVAGLYLFWSLLVYFGTLGHESHAYWPMFLYFIIWPASLLHGLLMNSNWLTGLPKSTPDWVWGCVDGVSGAFYIVVGTIWIWFLGRVFCRIITFAF